MPQLPTLTGLKEDSFSVTTATIHLPALAHNLNELRRLLSPNCEILAVVKAEGYGHGAIAIAKALTHLGISRFGVATIQEGATLREAGINGMILIMGGIFSWQIQDLIRHKLTPVISNRDIAFQLGEILPTKLQPFPVHLKIDTGMRRLGFPLYDLLPLLDSNLFHGPFFLEGLMTHMADANNQDTSFTVKQIDQFHTQAEQLRLAGWKIPYLHMANTAGILFFQEAHLGLVRPGLLLYGYSIAEKRKLPVTLKPIMDLTTKIVHIQTVDKGEPVSYNGIYRTWRTSRIAILPVGYAHGYSRRISNKGEVLIRNSRVPIVGQICMDMMLVDVTDLPIVEIGDTVVLMGKQGNESISALDIANWQETIPYEVICSLGSGINRIYEPLKEIGIE